MIEVDGSHGEGGGAILRQALGMAAYAGIPLRVRKVRAGRTKPGLAAQHLKAVEAVGAICGARVRGASLGSQEIMFDPGEVRGGDFGFDIGTAGATTLLLQTVLLPCLLTRAEFEFDLTGGTDVAWSPPADYLSRVTLPTLSGFGRGRIRVSRRGYYPKGGGRLQAKLAGGSAGDFRFELRRPGEVKAILGVSHASRGLRDRGVAERQADAAEHLLERLGHPVEIAIRYSAAAGLGSGITLWTESAGGPPLAGSALGEKGKPADEVGREAARSLMMEMEAGGAVDRHLADQLIPFMAVVGGSVTTSEITGHVRSNIYVAERVLGAGFRVEGTTIIATPSR